MSLHFSYPFMLDCPLEPFSATAAPSFVRPYTHFCTGCQGHFPRKEHHGQFCLSGPASASDSPACTTPLVATVHVFVCTSFTAPAPGGPLRRTRPPGPRAGTPSRRGGPPMPRLGPSAAVGLCRARPRRSKASAAARGDVPRRPRRSCIRPNRAAGLPPTLLQLNGRSFGSHARNIGIHGRIALAMRRSIEGNPVDHSFVFNVFSVAPAYPSPLAASRNASMCSGGVPGQRGLPLAWTKGPWARASAWRATASRMALGGPVSSR